MRILVQRSLNSSVSVDGKIVGAVTHVLIDSVKNYDFYIY